MGSLIALRLCDGVGASGITFVVCDCDCPRTKRALFPNTGLRAIRGWHVLAPSTLLDSVDASCSVQAIRTLMPCAPPDTPSGLQNDGRDISLLLSIRYPTRRVRDTNRHQRHCYRNLRANRSFQDA